MARTFKPPKSKYPPQTVARCLELYRSRSAREVSDITGVPHKTIQSWARGARRKHDAVSPPKDATPAERESWAERKEAAALESFETAQEALAEVRRLMAEGKYHEAQKTALTFAITTDKSGVLEDAAQNAVARQARLDEQASELVADIIVRSFKDVGLGRRPGKPVQEVVLHYVEQAARGEALKGPAPTAKAAQQSVEDHVLAAWQSRQPPEAPLALPPGDPPPQPEPVEPVGEPLVIDAEVVEETEPATSDQQDGTCPSCGEAIPPEQLEAHLAGLDRSRLDCPRQDVEAIARAERERRDPWAQIEAES